MVVSKICELILFEKSPFVSPLSLFLKYLHRSGNAVSQEKQRRLTWVKTEGHRFPLRLGLGLWANSSYLKSLGSQQIQDESQVLISDIS